MNMTIEDKRYQTEDDMRTLSRAEEIKKDPERMKCCRDMAKNMMDSMGDGKKAKMPKKK